MYMLGSSNMGECQSGAELSMCTGLLPAYRTQLLLLWA